MLWQHLYRTQLLSFPQKIHSLIHKLSSIHLMFTYYYLIFRTFFFSECRRKIECMVSKTNFKSMLSIVYSMLANISAIALLSLLRYLENTEIYAYMHVLAELDEPCFPVNDATIFIEL